jgi:thiol:disulfide interchange protein DsbD
MENKKSKFSCLLIPLLLLFCFSIQAEEENEFLPVEQAFPYQTDFTDDSLQVDWQISSGYYLYQSRIFATQDNQPLAVDFPAGAIEKEDEYFGKVKIFKHNLALSIKLHSHSPIQLTFQGCAEEGLCYPPVSIMITPPTQAPIATASLSPVAATSEQGYIDNLLHADSLIWKLTLFFVLGVGLAFTPCVFPMFPILSSIIVGQGKKLSTYKAFILSLSYVLGMAFTYAIAGVVVGYFGATANIQLYLQTPWVLVLFSLLFVALSFSMFGFYELTLPRFIQDKLQSVNSSQQQNGQVWGTALMGAISALVVSPCVSAPLAGVLAYISSTGDALLGGSALLALAIGMGVPLLIIGTGGGRFLPKSGNWMNSIKNIFGVALLAVAIWLLSRVIPAQITLLLWSALLFISGVYLGAFESGTQGWFRFYKGTGLLLCLYAAMLMFDTFNGEKALLTAQTTAAQPNKQQHSPYAAQISSKVEFEKLLQASQTTEKVIIVDFYADWCVSCKIMEKEIFAQADIQQMLQGHLFVQLDISKNSPDQLALLEQFHLFGPPAVLFFQKGHQLEEHKLVGEFSKDEFFNHLIQLQNI